MSLIFLWKHNQRIGWSRLKRSVAKRVGVILSREVASAPGKAGVKGKFFTALERCRLFQPLRIMNYLAIEGYWRHVSWFYYDWFKRRFKTGSKLSYLQPPSRWVQKHNIWNPNAKLLNANIWSPEKEILYFCRCFVFIFAVFFCICRVLFADGDWEVEPARRGEELRWCGGGADVLHPDRTACHCCRPHPCCVSFQSHLSFRLWPGFGFCFFSRFWLWFLKI